jgi:hypothetical protein
MHLDLDIFFFFGGDLTLGFFTFFGDLGFFTFFGDLGFFTFFGDLGFFTFCVGDGK